MICSILGLGNTFLGRTAELTLSEGNESQSQLTTIGDRAEHFNMGKSDNGHMLRER